MHKKDIISLSADDNFWCADDNFWCAVFERAVKHYVRKSHNCKGIKNIFPKSEARREFLKSIVQPKKSTAERS